MSTSTASPAGTSGNSPPDDGIFVPASHGSRWKEPWFRWTVLGVSATLLLAVIGTALFFNIKPRETDHIEVYVTDIPGDFAKLELTVGGVYVDDAAYGLEVEQRSFDILEYRGTERALKIAAGDVPHGPHDTIILVFSNARGYLDDAWMDIKIPKKMLKLSVAFNFADSRAGAVLLDLDMGKSLVLTDDGFIFAPFVSDLYVEDLGKLTPAGQGEGPWPDLSFNGFRENPWTDFDQLVDDPPPDVTLPTTPSTTQTAVITSTGGPGPCQTECSTTTGTDPEGSTSVTTAPTPYVLPTVGEYNCPPDDENCQSLKTYVDSLVDLYQRANENVTWVVQAVHEAKDSDDGPQQQVDRFVGPDSPIGPYLNGPEQQRVEELVERYGGIVDGYLKSGPQLMVKMTRTNAWSLSQEDAIEYVEDVSGTLKFHSMSSTKEAIRWCALQGGCAEASTLPPALPYSGHGVGIAMIDTGVDATHPALQFDLTGQRPPEAVVYENWDMVSVVPARSPNTESYYGHGTHVAGIMVGQKVADVAGQAHIVTPGGGTYWTGYNSVTNANYGVNVPAAEADFTETGGLAPGARLYAYGTGEGTTLLWAVQALDHLIWCIDNGCFDPAVKVVQNSWSTGTAYDPNSVITWQVNQLVDRGVTVVFSAGNNGGTGSAIKTSAQCQIPREGVVCVGGFDDKGKGDRDGGSVYSYTSRGQSSVPESWPDLVGVAVNVNSTKPAAGTLGGAQKLLYAPMSGTSVAAPQVSACVALLYEANPTLTPAQVEYVLEQTAHPFSQGGTYAVSVDYRYNGSHYAKGHGLLDCEAAVEAAALYA